jgi:SAM-dependent methyltransferase
MSRPEVWKCRKCRHFFTNPSFWDQQIGNEYELLTDSEYLALVPTKLKTFGRAFRKLQKYFPKPQNRILEIGSYAGLFLKIAQDNGNEVLGIEPSHWGVENSQVLGVPALQGMAENILPTIAGEVYDLTIAWDVIEHVKDPQRLLKLMGAMTAHSGYVVVSTVVVSSWSAKLLGKRWPWIIPMHLHYFSNKNMATMGRNVGLNLIEDYPHVHYSNLIYILKKLGILSWEMRSNRFVRYLEMFDFPVALGDVRTFIYQKNNNE